MNFFRSSHHLAASLCPQGESTTMHSEMRYRERGREGERKRGRGRERGREGERERGREGERERGREGSQKRSKRGRRGAREEDREREEGEEERGRQRESASKRTRARSREERTSIREIVCVSEGRERDNRETEKEEETHKRQTGRMSQGRGFLYMMHLFPRIRLIGGRRPLQAISITGQPGLCSSTKRILSTRCAVSSQKHLSLV